MTPTLDLVTGSRIGELCALEFIAQGFHLNRSFTLPSTPYQPNTLSAPVCSVHDLPNHPRPDYLLCVGYSRLLPPEALQHPTKLAIGSHPTPLPYGRGRHPAEWQIALGETDSSYTFFQLDPGVDTGPILLSVPYEIHAAQTRQTLNNHIEQTARKAASILAYMLLHGSPTPMPQPSRGTLFRKRDIHDGLLDFRMSASALDRSTRTGYGILRCSIGNVPVVSCIPHPLPDPRQGHGFVWSSQPGKIAVEADDALVWLTLPEGTAIPDAWIHPPTHYTRTTADVL